MRTFAWAGLIAAIFCSADAQAEPPPNEAILAEMHTYFGGEANESWGFGAAGLLSLSGASLGLFAAKDDVYRGAAYPLAAVGIIQLAAGIILGLRTHRQVEERDRMLDREGQAFWDLEIPRMRRVQKQFAVLEVVEIGLAVVGLGLAAYGGRAQERTVTGVGIGLAVEAGAMLALDHAAGQRADRYMRAILESGLSCSGRRIPTRE